MKPQRQKTYILIYQVQRSLRSDCASAQSDHSIRCQHEETLSPLLSKVRTARILIRLRECAQSDQNLRWAPMSECTFPYVAVQIIVHVIFYFFWDHWAHQGYFENRIPLKLALGGGGGGGAYAASQTTVLHMKRLNQIESPILVILYVLCFQRLYFLTFNLLYFCIKFLWFQLWQPLFEPQHKKIYPIMRAKRRLR